MFVDVTEEQRLHNCIGEVNSHDSEDSRKTLNDGCEKKAQCADDKQNQNRFLETESVFQVVHRQTSKCHGSESEDVDDAEEG